MIPFKHQYDFGNSFCDGMAMVKLNEKWGYIDKTGNEIIPIGKYDWGRGFKEGMRAVSLNNKWRYIDKTGNEIIPCKYDLVHDFSEEIAMVEMNGKSGYIYRD